MTLQVTAIIPARGGSKGVPDKNLQEVEGASLVARSVRTALAAKSVTRTVVSSDSDAILTEARDHGAEALRRPSELSGDTASSESALLHAVETLGLHDDVLVFLQCTSPFVASTTVDDAIGLVTSGAADTAFAATVFHGFLWNADGSAQGHDLAFRPRRQDLPQRWLEQGGFYVFRAADLLTSGTRFNGRIRPVEISPIEALEIDTFEELEIARAVAASLAVAPATGNA